MPAPNTRTSPPLSPSLKWLFWRIGRVLKTPDAKMDLSRLLTAVGTPPEWTGWDLKAWNSKNQTSWFIEAVNAINEWFVTTTGRPRDQYTIKNVEPVQLTVNGYDDWEQMIANMFEQEMKYATIGEEHEPGERQGGMAEQDEANRTAIELEAVTAVQAAVRAAVEDAVAGLPEKVAQAVSSAIGQDAVSASAGGHAARELARRQVSKSHASGGTGVGGEQLLAVLEGKEQSPPSAVRAAVRDLMHIPLPDFTQAFNDWVHAQKPVTYADRQELAETIRWLVTAMQAELRYDGKPCSVTTAKSPIQAEGAIRVVELGSKKRLVSSAFPRKLGEFEVIRG